MRHTGNECRRDRPLKDSSTTTSSTYRTITISGPAGWRIRSALLELLIRKSFWRRIQMRPCCTSMTQACRKAATRRCIMATRQGWGQPFVCPAKNGNVGGIVVTDQAFDRAAMRALIQAFRAQPMASRVFLNDETLIHEGLCQAVAGHDNHAHFEIKPPVRVMP